MRLCLSALVAVVVVVTACAPVDGGEGEGEEGEGEGEGGEFVVVSDAFVEGGAIPAAFTCDGANVSPPLRWSGAPDDAQGFALAVTDLSIDFLHSTLWDIDAAATALPEGVENAFSPGNVDGAHQSLGYDGVTRGYLGPCPPETHTYEFRLYAVDAAVLDLDEDSGRAAAVAAFDAAAIASATLTATYTPP